MNSFQELRKHSSTHDIYNRLHSIARDMTFVDEMREWFDSRLAVVQTSSSEYAYFKSTDGHMNQWDFSLRRSNLSLISFAISNHGFILVDSTRRGKRFPDSLSKTVPIWCCVINRAISRIRALEPATQSDDAEGFAWDNELYTSPQAVSPQEKVRIEEKLDGWVSELLASSLSLPPLTKPLRPLFISPSITLPPTLPPPETTPFIPIVLLTASMFVEQGDGRQMKDQWGGFEYVQGSGDDEELWGKGLTAEMFHSHREELLSCPKDDLPSLIEAVVSKSTAHPTTINISSPLFPPNQIPEKSHIYLALNTSPLPHSDDTKVKVITLITNSSTPPPTLSKDRELRFFIPEGKKGQILFSEEVLPHAIVFERLSRQEGAIVVIRDEEGRDLSVGLAMVLLWKAFDDDGMPRKGEILEATKEGIRTRLHWIIQRRPGANPSRTTLKWVNSFLMSPPRTR